MQYFRHSSYKSLATRGLLNTGFTMIVFPKESLSVLAFRAATLLAKSPLKTTYGFKKLSSSQDAGPLLPRPPSAAREAHLVGAAKLLVLSRTPLTLLMLLLTFLISSSGSFRAVPYK